MEISVHQNKKKDWIDILHVASVSNEYKEKTGAIKTNSDTLPKQIMALCDS